MERHTLVSAEGTPACGVVPAHACRASLRPPCWSWTVSHHNPCEPNIFHHVERGPSTMSRTSKKKASLRHAALHQRIAKE